MTGSACAAAAADLAELATRLQRAGQALGRQAVLPTRDFEGMSGMAFRHHAARSAVVAADAARDVSLLADGLADLGHGLDSAQALRDRAAAADGGATERLLDRAVRVEERAQDAWRVALGRFEGAVNGSPQGAPAQPVVSHPPLERSGPDPEPAPEESAAVPATPPGAARGGAVVAPQTPGSGRRPDAVQVTPPEASDGGE